MPECLACQAPLGADSIALSFKDDNGDEHAYCATHRRCALCNVSMTPNDLKFAYSMGITENVRHPRCMISQLKPTDETSIDKLIKIINWAATMPNTQVLVKDMDFQQMYLFNTNLREISANVSILLGRDKKHYAALMASKEQEEKQARKAPKPNPIKKAAAVGITTTSEKVARQKLTARDKAINALLPLYLSIGKTRADVEQTVDNQMRTN